MSTPVMIARGTTDPMIERHIRVALGDITANPATDPGDRPDTTIGVGTTDRRVRMTDHPDRHAATVLRARTIGRRARHGETGSAGPRPPYPRDRYPNRAPDPNRDRVPDRRPSYRGDRYADRGPSDHRPPPRPGSLALPPPDALEPDEELVAGRRPVEEAFVARRPARRLLVVPNRRAALEKIVLHATNLRIPIVEVEGGSLTALAGFDGHQGIALVVEPRQFASLDDILARANERDEPPFILVLDSLEDPHNVGSLLRSAEGAGVHGVIFPTHRQAPLSASAVKASAGAIEHLLLYPADDLPATLTDLHGRGVRIVGADGQAPLTARQTDLRGPLALVVGSEGQGLGSAVRRRADAFMRIPMKGAVGSLNAAVAGSILLFEALAQRDLGTTVAPPPEDEAPADTPPPEPVETLTSAPESSAELESVQQPDPRPKAARATRRTKTEPPAVSASEPPGDALLPTDAKPKPTTRSRRKASS